MASWLTRQRALQKRLQERLAVRKAACSKATAFIFPELLIYDYG
jgi:hypothetical protein